MASTYKPSSTGRKFPPTQNHPTSAYRACDRPTVKIPTVLTLRALGAHTQNGFTTPSTSLRCAPRKRCAPAVFLIKEIAHFEPKGQKEYGSRISTGFPDHYGSSTKKTPAFVYRYSVETFVYSCASPTGLHSTIPADRFTAGYSARTCTEPLILYVPNTENTSPHSARKINSIVLFSKVCPLVIMSVVRVFAGVFRKPFLLQCEVSNNPPPYAYTN